MGKGSVIQVAAVLVALAAAFVCQQLLDRHITGKPGPTWFEAGCSDATETSGGANCAAVLASPWSYWPPVAEGDPPDKPRIPVAFMGLVYYGVLAVWFLGVGRPSRTRRWVLLLPAIIMIPGLAASAFFIYVMFTKLDAWCPWCMVTHVLNVLLAVSLFLLVPRRQQADSATAKATNEAAHPTWRLGLMTLVGMGLVISGMNRQYGRSVAEKSYRYASANLSRCVTEIRKIQEDGNLLLAKFLRGKVKQIHHRPDDAYRVLGPAQTKPLQLVIFSDFECPSCRKIAEFLEKDAQRLFGGALAVVFKHYPLDQSCNPHSARTLHPYACEAARMAEAARQLGGNDAFWNAHDYIYTHQQDLKHGRLKVAALARAVGVGVDALTKEMNAKAASQRIEGDIADAVALGVHGTPTIFAEGRRVGALFMHEIAFWDKLADYYWQKLGVKRPVDAMLIGVDTTPDSPGRTAVP